MSIMAEIARDEADGRKRAIEKREQQAYVSLWYRKIADIMPPFFPGAGIVAVALAHRHRGMETVQDTHILHNSKTMFKLKNAEKIADWAGFTRTEKQILGYHDPRDTVVILSKARKAEKLDTTAVCMAAGVQGEWENGKVEATAKVDTPDCPIKYTDITRKVEREEREAEIQHNHNIAMSELWELATQELKDLGWHL